MALLYITESPGLTTGGKGELMPVFAEPGITTQRVLFTTATQSAAFNGATRVIRIYSDTACNIAFGSNPTATATSPRYAAATEYFRAVKAADKLSVYDGSS